MLSLNGVSAWVEVDGKELEQCGVQEDPDHNQVTCWIVTQVGKSFSVVFMDNAAHREHSLGSTLKLDGLPAGGKVLCPAPRTGASPVTRTVVQSDQVLSTTSSRPFIFSKLELTEEDEYLDRVSAHLGEIEIRIYRAQNLGPVPFKPVAGTPGHSKVHERSKKAVTHCVSYGQEVNTPTRYFANLRYLDGDAPLATFVFKYNDGV